MPRLDLTRSQILAFRRHADALDERRSAWMTGPDGAVAMVSHPGAVADLIKTATASVAA